VQCSCINAHLDEEQISIGVVAVGQGCCEASLQSNTEQWESYCVLTSAAVQWSCINAHLDEEQISIGVVAVSQGCCEASLQSDTEQCIGLASMHTWMKSKSP